MRPGRLAQISPEELEQMSPAEELAETLFPLAAVEEPEQADPIRLWEPKGIEGLGAPPAQTIAGEQLRFSFDPPLTAGGAPPGLKTPFARFERAS